MTLPEQLLLSDLLRRRVRCQADIDHGPGVLAWMHPPVHRLLGWISKPSAFGERRQAWRLDQLRALAELEALVQGEGADTDLPTCERLPTLIEATLLDRRGDPIGTLADAAVELSTGRIRHYLVSRSDPRLPGSSRWRLSPDRIVDQKPGEVFTSLEGLDDLPLARASVRQEFLRRSRRWRDQVQDAGTRFEQRMEGWLEEPPWDSPEPRRSFWEPDGGVQRDEEEGWDAREPGRPAASREVEPWDDQWDDLPAERYERRPSRRAPRDDDDPWI